MRRHPTCMLELEVQELSGVGCNWSTVLMKDWSSARARGKHYSERLGIKSTWMVFDVVLLIYAHSIS